MRQQLRLELGSLNLSLLRAALILKSDSRVSITSHVLRDAELLPTGDVIRLQSCSVIRPLVSILCGGDAAQASSSLEEQANIGKSSACLHDARGEVWPRRGRPLPPWACVGAPDARRPWILVAPGLREDEATLEETTGLHNAQAHFLGAPWEIQNVEGVLWLPRPSTIESLLGHVDAVVAPDGPLAWDAARLGTPVFHPREASAQPLSLERLARIVPASLHADPAFWRSLLTDLLEGAGTAGWGTLPWLRRARELSVAPRTKRVQMWALRDHSPNTVGLIKRKVLKLRRNPGAFWADSRLGALVNWKVADDRRR